MTKNTTKTITPYIKKTIFGDGYKQITGDGYVALKEQWDTEFVPMTKALADELEDILLATKDGRHYYFQTTMPYESQVKVYSADNITKTPVFDNLWQIRCTLTMEFVI